MSKVRHTITISFTTSEEVANHPAIKKVMHDMEAQLESLIDGTYDEETDESSTWGVNTMYQDVDAEYSNDLDDKIDNILLTGRKHG